MFNDEMYSEAPSEESVTAGEVLVPDEVNGGAEAEQENEAEAAMSLTDTQEASEAAIEAAASETDANIPNDAEAAVSEADNAAEDASAEADEAKAVEQAEEVKNEKPKQKRNRISRSAPKPVLDENGNVIERLSTEKAMQVLEAILFANGDEVYYEQYAKIIGYSVKEAKEIVETYAKLYDNGAFPRGIRLTCYEKCCQLSTCPELGEYVTKMIGIRGEPQLSNAAMETLAIIAYNQPVTRAYVEQVRRVDSTRPITVLLDRELIEEVGRLEVIGRPRLFGVTQNFFRTFGISSLDELPALELFGIDNA